MPVDALSAVSGFLRWWGGALRACLPGALDRRIFGSGDRLELVFSEGRVAAEIADAEGRSSVLDIALDETDPAPARRALGRALRGRSWSGFPVLRLDRHRVLETRVELPVEAADNLREALVFGMDTHTPFPAEDVAFDYRVLGSDEDLERLEIDLLVAQREDVRRTQALARRLGFATDRVSGPAESPAAELNLLDEAARARPSRALGWVAAGLAALAIGLGGAALWQRLDRLETELALADAHLVRLRAIAGAAADIEDRIERLEASATMALSLKRERGLAIALLDEVTRRLADGSWLTGWSLERGVLELSGFSDDPAGILRRLEASDRLADVHFTAPVTADRQTGRDRFSISARVVVEDRGDG